MIRDITLGQYFQADSFIHRLDPRVKVIATLLFIIELFIIDSFIGFGVCAAVLITTVIISKVPFSFIFRGMKPILIILIFTFMLNMFMLDGTVIWQWKFLHITDRGLYMAAFMGIRLIMLIVGASLLTFTTTPIRLTDGMERLMSPLAAVRVPTHEIAMMMSIALRFVPTLLDEADKIIKAQQARGADFESGNILARAKALIPILVPLFISAFRIAQDLAIAMEARCYHGGQGRTRLHSMKFQSRDYVTMALLFAFLGLVICMKIWF